MPQPDSNNPHFAKLANAKCISLRGVNVGVGVAAVKDSFAMQSRAN